MDLNDSESVYKDDRHEIKNRMNNHLELIEILGEKNVSIEEVDLLTYTKDISMIALNWTAPHWYIGTIIFIYLCFTST